MTMAQRDLFDIGKNKFGVADLVDQLVDLYSDQNFDDTTFDHDEDVPWTRPGVDGW